MRKSGAILGAVAAVLGCVAPASAFAGTATVVNGTQGRGSDPVQHVRYTGAAGEANRVTARLTVSGGVGTATLTDTAGATPGPGCTRPIPSNTTVVSCRLGNGSGTGVAANAFEFGLGDGNDVAQIVSSPTTSGDFDGGSGNDVLRAGGGSGGDPDDPGLPNGATMRGGPGNDVVEGGPGDDVLAESGTAANGSDTLTGGAGNDLVTYAGRTRAVRADLAGDRDDGQRGERDQISGVQNLTGGRAGDRLTGSLASNVLVGGGGSDVLAGAGGSDTLHASTEVFFAGRSRTRDRLSGGAGRDYLVGTAGGNRIDPGTGPDTVEAGGGNDRIRARDKSSDDVSCGRGHDRVVLDRFDAIDRGCERIARNGAPRAVYVTQVSGLDLLGTAARPYADPRIACPADIGASCRVTATLSRRGVTLGRARARVRRGGGREVFVFLNRTGRALAGPSVLVRLTVRTATSRGVRTAFYRVRIESVPS